MAHGLVAVARRASGSALIVAAADRPGTLRGEEGDARPIYRSPSDDERRPSASVINLCRSTCRMIYDRHTQGCGLCCHAVWASLWWHARPCARAALSGADQSGSLAARTIKGAGWLMGWRMASRLLGIVNTVVLVRLLAPSDFGLVALAMSFSLAIDGLSYIGVQDALVREPVLDRAMYDTGFTMGVLRGLLTALIVAACAWPAARSLAMRD